MGAVPVREGGSVDECVNNMLICVLKSETGGLKIYFVKWVNDKKWLKLNAYIKKFYHYHHYHLIIFQNSRRAAPPFYVLRVYLSMLKSKSPCLAFRVLLP